MIFQKCGYVTQLMKIIVQTNGPHIVQSGKKLFCKVDKAFEKSFEKKLASLKASPIS